MHLNSYQENKKGPTLFGGIPEDHLAKGEDLENCFLIGTSSLLQTPGEGGLNKSLFCRTIWRYGRFLTFLSDLQLQKRAPFLRENMTKFDMGEI